MLCGEYIQLYTSKSFRWREVNYIGWNWIDMRKQRCIISIIMFFLLFVANIQVTLCNVSLELSWASCIQQEKIRYVTCILSYHAFESFVVEVKFNPAKRCEASIASVLRFEWKTSSLIRHRSHLEGSILVFVESSEDARSKEGRFELKELAKKIKGVQWSKKLVFFCRDVTR